MNIQKFTQKSIEAINNCEKLAYEYGNQEIDQEHLLYSLVTIDDSLILKLIEKMEINLKISSASKLSPKHLRNPLEGRDLVHRGPHGQATLITTTHEHHSMTTNQE